MWENKIDKTTFYITKKIKKKKTKNLTQDPLT